MVGRFARTSVVAAAGENRSLTLQPIPLAALLADDLRLAFGRTVAVGMLLTAVVSIALVAFATVADRGERRR